MRRRPDVLRALLALAVLAAATGCPPIQEMTVVLVEVRSGGRPLPGAWVIWPDHGRSRSTNSAGKLEIDMYRWREIPTLVLHHEAGAQRVGGLGSTMTRRPPVMRHGTRFEYIDATLDLNGFGGDRLDCTGGVCRAAFDVSADATCGGRFVFVSAGGGPIFREVPRDRMRGPRWSIEAVAPLVGGGAAFIGECVSGTPKGPIFASGPFPSTELSTAPADPAVEALRARQALSDMSATLDDLLAGAADPRPDVRAAAVAALAARLSVGHDQRFGTPGDPLEEPPREVWLPRVVAAREILLRLVADPATPAVPPSVYSDLLFHLTRRHELRRALGLGPTFRCDTHRCTAPPGCVGRFGYYCVPIDGPLPPGTPTEPALASAGYARGAAPFVSRRLHVGDPGEPMPCSPIDLTDVLFAGTCEEGPRIELGDAKPDLPFFRVERLIGDLGEPAHRASAARALRGVATQAVPSFDGLNVHVRTPLPRATTAEHADRLLAPLIAAATDDDPRGRGAAIDAIDAIVGPTLIIQPGRAPTLRALTEPLMPDAIAQAADPDRAPIALLALHAERAEAAAALGAALDRAHAADAPPGALTGALERLPPVEAARPLVAPRLGDALRQCPTTPCRDEVYRLMAAWDDAAHVSDALDRFAQGDAAAAVVITRQPPTPATIDRLAEIALGPWTPGGRTAAARMLAELPPPDAVIDRAIAALADRGLRRAALIVLDGRPDHPRAFGALYATLRDGDGLEPSMALASLARVETTGGVAVVIEVAARHPVLELRLAAIKALGQMKTAPRARRAALQRIVDSRRGAGERARAAEVLSRL